MNSVWNMIIKDMRILRYILATLAVLATFTACREEDELNKAKGRVVLGEIRIEAEEANTRAIAIPTPQPKDLTIEIIDPDGYTVESGKIDHYANGIDLFVASYTLRAYYGNKQQMGNSPYFEGIVEFSISEGHPNRNCHSQTCKRCHYSKHTYQYHRPLYRRAHILCL